MDTIKIADFVFNEGYPCLQEPQGDCVQQGAPLLN